MQEECVPLDVATNLKTLRSAAKRAKEAGAELIVTPQLFVTGYIPRRLAEWMTPEHVAAPIPLLSDIALEEGIAVAASLPLIGGPEGPFHIGAMFFDEHGLEVLRYFKVHMRSDEDLGTFSLCDTPPRVASWKGRRIAFQIGYDIVFAEPSRYLARQGADLILVPAAIETDSTYISTKVVPTRAAENHAVVAYCDLPRSVDQPFVGLSTVAGPGGVVYDAADHGSELLIVEIPDPADPKPGEANHLADMRDEVYRSWWDAASEGRTAE